MQQQPAPSSSRMLASYLTDIERLLDEQQDDAALREACDLPRIAVALTDPQLRCSGDQVKTWCEQWIGPATVAPPSDLDYERVSERVSAAGPASAVPTRALKRLQLRRHVRTPPRGFSGGRTPQRPGKDAEAVKVCTALVEAARRWYARCACHDTIVQANLTRLAVLR